MKKIIYLVFAIFSCFHLFAQDAKEIENPAVEDENTVHVYEDSRIALIVNKPTVAKPSNRVRGYRVQIYNGNSRADAEKMKMYFMRQYPNTRAYITYNKPQFRVRVGDFRNRKEASDFMARLPKKVVSMIVPEIINLSNAPK